MGVGCQTRSWQDLYHNHNYLTKPLNQKIHIQKYKKYKKITAHHQENRTQKKKEKTTESLSKKNTNHTEKKTKKKTNF